MKFYYINTDSRVREGPVPTFDIWFQRGMAFAGDYSGDKGKHTTLFRKVEIGDALFMYHSGIGFVGLGEVEEKWDKKCYEGSERWLYLEDMIEYRIKVRWSFDWRSAPKSKQTLGLPATPNYYCVISPGKYKVVALVSNLKKEDRDALK